MAQDSAPATLRGFRPSDLLLLPEQERRLLTWLLRRGLVSFDDVVRELGLSAEVARDLLDLMTQRGLLVRNDAEEAERYQAALGGNHWGTRQETSHPREVKGDRSDEEAPN
jgi:hypothetical protein